MQCDVIPDMAPKQSYEKNEIKFILREKIETQNKNCLLHITKMIFVRDLYNNRSTEIFVHLPIVYDLYLIMICIFSIALKLPTIYVLHYYKTTKKIQKMGSIMNILYYNLNRQSTEEKKTSIIIII